MLLADTVPMARHAVLFFLIVSASYYDLSENRVPNWCTLPVIAVGLLLSFGEGGLTRGGYLNPQTVNLTSSLIALVLGATFFGLFYLSKLVGAGDVKLVAACGAVQGTGFLLQAVVRGAMVGFVLALGILLWQGRLWQGLKRGFRMALTLRRPADVPEDDPARQAMPLAFALAVGMLWAWFRVYLL